MPETVLSATLAEALPGTVPTVSTASEGRAHGHSVAKVPQVAGKEPCDLCGANWETAHFALGKLWCPSVGQGATPPRRCHPRQPSDASLTCGWPLSRGAPHEFQGFHSGPVDGVFSPPTVPGCNRGSSVVFPARSTRSEWNLSPVPRGGAGGNLQPVLAVGCSSFPAHGSGTPEGGNLRCAHE